MSGQQFSISSVELDTGLSKDLLRMWERRYGFPSPDRDGNGERVYSLEQLERLRLLKRLVDLGYRPGKLMSLTVSDLHLLASEGSASGSGPLPPGVERLLDILERHDVPILHLALQQALAEQGLKCFVLETLTPLVHAVGQAWETGRFQVFEEHLFSEQVLRLMRQALAPIYNGSGSPCILMTTVPEEHHLLGLIMAEAVFSLEGACCLALGAQTPILEIAAAVKPYRADVVALSFSPSFPLRRIAPLLQQLRQLLPAEVALWCGGAIMQKVECPAGVAALPSLEQGLGALSAWRQQQVAKTSLQGNTQVMR